MSKVSDDYGASLSVGEVIIVNDQFNEWLGRKNVPSRTTKNVLLRELSEFENKMSLYYGRKGTVSPHIDSLMLSKMKSGFDDYCRFAKLVIEEHDRPRISTSKFFESMYIFVQDKIAHLAIDAERICYDE